MQIKYETAEPGINLITFNRPEVLNALSWEAMEAFSAAVQHAAEDPGLRAVILTGAGSRAFCAGGDLVELAGYPAFEDGERLASIMTGALDTLAGLPVPVIAAINGFARGGGAEIALACDLRVIAENADMGFTQILLGLTPGWGGGQRLLHLVGYSRAVEWLMTGRVLSPGECHTHRLVNRVVPEGHALAEALAMAHRILAFPEKAVQGIKTLLMDGLQAPGPGAKAGEQQIFPPLWEDDAHLARVEAFLNRKRKD